MIRSTPNSLLTCPLIVLRGVGQVMFQQNALTGLLFLVGIAIASVPMFAGALAGAVLGLVTAYLLRFDRKELDAGLYGFDATLVGIAVFFAFQPDRYSGFLLVAGSVLATILSWGLRRLLPWPTYTTAFILVTWGVFAVAAQVGATPIRPFPGPTAGTFREAVLEGLSEVMLQANVWTGVLFLVGIALANWRHAVLALLGTLVGTLVALYHHDPTSRIAIGIYGYNAALAGIALHLWRPGLLIPILGMVATVPLTEHFPAGLATLTAPFVIACWAVILVGWLERWFRKAG